MTEEQLTESEARALRMAYASLSGPNELPALIRDVPALVAEIRRLKTCVVELTSQRDKMEELAVTRHGMWQAAEKRLAER